MRDVWYTPAMWTLGLSQAATSGFELLQGQQAFVLDSLDFVMGYHPFLAQPAATSTLFGEDSAKSTPFPNGELSFSKQDGNFGGRVELARRRPLPKNRLKHALDPQEPFFKFIF